jgi:rhodanese-related sulfurtransferase
MRLRLWSGIAIVAVLIAVLLSMPFLSACGGDSGTVATSPSPTSTTPPVTTTTTTTTPSATTEPAVAEFDVVKDAVADYLTHVAPNMKASDLHMAILEGDAPYIVSLRSAADYANGHIPGAVNMAFADITTLPIDEEILVYCYTGQSASFAAATLGVLGYDVSNLLHGMSSWTTDPAIYVTRFDPATGQGDYATETTVNAGGSYGYPTLDNTTSSDAAAIILAAAKTVAPKYITAADLHMKIAEGEEMTVIDLRAAENYAAGH